MRKLSIIILVILIPILIYAILPWLVLFVGYCIGETPNKPKIKYEEFPFELVYEMKNEEYTIKDTLVCQYDGIGISENSGKVRKWKSFLKSGKQNVVLLSYDNVTIYYDIGPAKYYMGDYNNHTFSPNIICETKYQDGTKSQQFIFDNELSNKYGIIIKRWSIRSPIQNSFQ